MRHYRGKQVDNSEWIKGWYCKVNDKHYIICESGKPYSPCGEDSCFFKNIFDHFFEVDPKTVARIA